MSRAVLNTLNGISTVSQMVEAFEDEGHCRQLLEAMVWPRGRICPRCGYRHSIAIAGRDAGKTKQPGLYQCSNGHCRYQFSVTTRTPLHSTKLPSRIWLMGMWLILQSDKGISSVRLAEALGISQQTAWRMGHALRLLMIREAPLEGVVEIDEVHIGGKPRKGVPRPMARSARRVTTATTKFPALVLVQRSTVPEEGKPAGATHTAVVNKLSASEVRRVTADVVDPGVHLMSDQSQLFAKLGSRVASYSTIRHRADEYVCGSVHVNSAEGVNSRIKRTVLGVFHHISQLHADLYLTEVSFRWSQRIVAGQATRRTRKGREVQRILWERIAPALQIAVLLRNAVGRELRRTRHGSVAVRSRVAAFC